MHDYLFEHQEVLDDRHLLEYAKRVGLDIKRFEKEISRHIFAPVIED